MSENEPKCFPFISRSKNRSPTKKEQLKEDVMSETPDSSNKIWFILRFDQCGFYTQ